MEPPGGVRAKSAGQEGPGALGLKGLDRAVWHVGTTGVGQTVEVASRSRSGEAHKEIGISILGKALVKGSGCRGYLVCCCPSE